MTVGETISPSSFTRLHMFEAVRRVVLQPNGLKADKYAKSQGGIG